MDIEEIQLWIEMSDELGDATDANIGRFALLRDRQAKEKDATIADLGERHEAFVREIQDEALRGEEFLSMDGRNRNWLAYNRFSGILAHCSAELDKENSNG